MDERSLVRSFEALLTRRKLKGCTSVGKGVRALGRIWIHGRGVIRLGDRVVLDGRTAGIELHARFCGEIRIGDDVTIDGGTSIEADQTVTLGARTRVGSFCKFIDAHFHGLPGESKFGQPPRPVTVEEDVDIGPRSLLLPGAHVGRSTVVGPGTVLTRRVPAHVVVSGQPVRSRPRHET